MLCWFHWHFSQNHCRELCKFILSCAKTLDILLGLNLDPNGNNSQSKCSPSELASPDQQNDFVLNGSKHSSRSDFQYEHISKKFQWDSVGIFFKCQYFDTEKKNSKSGLFFQHSDKEWRLTGKEKWEPKVTKPIFLIRHPILISRDVMKKLKQKSTNQISQFGNNFWGQTHMTDVNS